MDKPLIADAREREPDGSVWAKDADGRKVLRFRDVETVMRSLGREKG